MNAEGEHDRTDDKAIHGTNIYRFLFAQYRKLYMTRTQENISCLCKYLGSAGKSCFTHSCKRHGIMIIRN